MKYDDVCKKNGEKMSNRPLLVNFLDNSSKNVQTGNMTRRALKHTIIWVSALRDSSQ